METTEFTNDIKVFYVTATSFPAGILDSHQKLHSLIPFSPDRKYFGISRPENGGIIEYKAAAEELEPREGEKLNCKTLILKSGKYITVTIKDYLKDVQSIQRTFNGLLKHPDIDPQGYCVEWYFNDKDVKCMVRLQ